MKVCVTGEHIEHGKIRNSQHCMIADAIKTACPMAQYIMVDLQSIRYTNPATKKRYTYFTPTVAQQNLLKFDRGDKGLKPFTFTLANPQTREMGWRGQHNGLTRKRPKQTAAHKRKYAYLNANRQRGKQVEREFGLRKFAE